MIQRSLLNRRSFFASAPAGDHPLTAEVDGVRTAKFVRLPVQPREA